LPGASGLHRGSPFTKYLMYALMAEGDDIRRFGGGSTHTTIYFPEIRALHICLAPKIEQAEIVRRIEAAFARIDRIVDEHGNASRLLPRLDQAILVKAFRGELVAHDPNDKPVELSATPFAERSHGRRARSTRQRAEAAHILLLTNHTYDDLGLRMGGVFLFALGMIVTSMIINRASKMYSTTLFVRAFIITSLLVLYGYYGDPALLAICAVVKASPGHAMRQAYARRQLGTLARIIRGVKPGHFRG
jgi:hypothetical protein